MAKIREKIFELLCLTSALLPIIFITWLLSGTVMAGFARLDINFITGLPSRFAENCGIFPSLIGTFYLLILTAIIALPLAVFTAIYLEEYARESRLKRLIEMNVTNMAGVPSIIFGLLGLELFVRTLGLGSSIIAGALTLALLILPIIITATRESLKTVPYSYREAGLALGASKLYVIIKVVLPLAYSQIITGAILGISRAAGETAPLIVIGAATYLAFVPDSLLSDFTALPLQIFNWAQRPQKGFADNAAAAIIILLLLLAVFNSLAAYIRHKSEKLRVNL